MRVLSMFDGIACARLSLSKRPTEYVGYEIDTRLHSVVESRFADVQLYGDVTLMPGRHRMPKRFDVLVAGSPCQGFSKAGKGLGFDDPRSRLYFEFEKVKNTVNPQYWMLENVKMSNADRDFISERLKTEPLEICASSVCAQRRPRLYWTNFPTVELERVTPTDARLFIDWSNQTPNSDSWHRWWETKREYALRKQYSVIISKYDPALAPTMTRRQMACWNGTLVELNSGKYRFATPEELERLAGIPIGYTSTLPKNKRYEALGNGWNLHVTKQLFAGLINA